ncbi:hypothetical protein M1M98_03035 [Thermodesulfovibrionales bacterium]|nr:hypothetical protein [Thermodesulfovibrionales bacterium]MCL0085525.1 hypothetical protein [Thermodesulfovibrionales bacterium]
MATVPKKIVVVRDTEGTFRMFSKLMLEGQEVRPDAVIRGSNLGVAIPPRLPRSSGSQ